MKMSATKEQIDAIAVRRQAVADFEASAPERNVWEQSVYAALRSEWDEGGAIKVADRILKEWRARFRVEPAEMILGKPTGKCDNCGGSLFVSALHRCPRKSDALLPEWAASLESLAKSIPDNVENGARMHCTGVTFVIERRSLAQGGRLADAAGKDESK